MDLRLVKTQATRSALFGISRRLLLACGLFFYALSSPLYAQQNVAQDTPGEKNTATKHSTKVIERKFSNETLYALLVAEIAGGRQQFDISLTNYVQQAKQTRDPQVAARATMIARYLNDNAIALEMSLLWLETAPKDKDALTNASLSLLQAGQLQEAFDISKRIKQEGGEPAFQTIAANAGSLTQTQRDRLIQNYKNLLQRYSNDEQLLVGTGTLLQQQQKFEDAMDFANKALKIYPQSILAAALEANLLHELKRDREAIAKMGSLLVMYPDNTDLRTQYAQILTHYDMALAQQQYSILSDQLPNNANIKLTLGVIAMGRKDYKLATKAFEQLLDFDDHASTAHFYLAQLAEAKQNLSEAIFNYLQVEPGNDFLSATINLLDIFIRKNDFLSAQQHMDRARVRFPNQAESLYLLHSQALIKRDYLNEAETVLNDGLQAKANSTQLLFARAMLYNKRHQNTEAERDLNRILQLEPENAVALNSLGYLFTDNSQRYSEARALLSKALALKPNDPAILDSMGWLHFRTGNYPKALDQLRRAYELSPDPAIAAHLGEVLWVTGSLEEARNIWREAIIQSPEDTNIPATIKRLKAN